MYFKVTEGHTYPAVCPVSSEDLRSVRDSGSDDGHPGRSVLSHGVSRAHAHLTLSLCHVIILELHIMWWDFFVIE